MALQMSEHNHHLHPLSMLYLPIPNPFCHSSSPSSETIGGPVSCSIDEHNVTNHKQIQTIKTGKDNDHCWMDAHLFPFLYTNWYIFDQCGMEWIAISTMNE
jgi:hypothetical protein